MISIAEGREGPCFVGLGTYTIEGTSKKNNKNYQCSIRMKKEYLYRVRNSRFQTCANIENIIYQEK